MMHGFKRTTAAVMALVLMLAVGISYGEEGSKGILYKAENGGVTVYLLGSIHVGNDEMYPLGEAIEKAMEQADIFVFECDTASKDAGRAAQELMYYAGDGHMMEAISPATYQKLEAVCSQTGQNLQGIARMRPWAAMTHFSRFVTVAELGVDNEASAIALGVESVVSSYAAKNKKALEYLENTRGQLETFDRMSPALQEYLLDEALTIILNPELIQGMDATIREWPGWWKDGKNVAFADAYRKSYLQNQQDEKMTVLFAEYHETFMTTRNQTMTDIIEGYLRGEEEHTYFITVGLLHLVLPEDSIVQRLEDRGFTVDYLGE